MFPSKSVATRFLHSSLGISALLTCAVLPGAAQNNVCKMVNIGHLPGATITYANGISNDGQIVGVSGNRAFSHHGSAMNDLGTLGGQTAYAYGINSSRQIVGFSDLKNGNTHAFLYESGMMKDLGTLGGSNSYAFGINEAGAIVGQAQTTSGAYHAFVYQHGGMMDIGSFAGDNSIAYRINNNGEIVGSSYINATDFHAFSYQNGVMKDLGTGPGMVDSEAFGINDAGQIVGYSETADASQVRGFLYEKGMLDNLGTLGGNASFAADINKRHVIAGYATLGNGDFRSTVYLPGVIYDLGTLPNDTQSFALAMNNKSQIVGYSSRPSGNAKAYVCKFTAGNTENENE